MTDADGVIDDVFVTVLLGVIVFVMVLVGVIVAVLDGV